MGISYEKKNEKKSGLFLILSRGVSGDILICRQLLGKQLVRVYSEKQTEDIMKYWTNLEERTKKS